MKRFERWRLRRRNTATVDRSDALGRLQAQLAALEADIVVLSQTLTDARANHAEAEARALTAIRAGDDRSAWVVLAQQKELAERVAVLEEELRVLRILCEECRADVVAATDTTTSRPPA